MPRKKLFFATYRAPSDAGPIFRPDAKRATKTVALGSTDSSSLALLSAVRAARLPVVFAGALMLPVIAADLLGLLPLVLTPGVALLAIVTAVLAVFHALLLH